MSAKKYRNEAELMQSATNKMQLMTQWLQSMADKMQLMAEAFQSATEPVQRVTRRLQLGADWEGGDHSHFVSVIFLMSRNDQH